MAVLELGQRETGWRILREDDDAAAEGTSIFHLKGTLTLEEMAWEDPKVLGARWGEGNYLCLHNAHGTLWRAQTIRVVMTPTFREWKPGDDELPVD